MGILNIFTSGRKRREKALRDIVLEGHRRGYVRLTALDLQRAVENRQIEIHNNRIK